MLAFFILAAFALLAGWVISSVMEHYFGMDTDPHDELVIDYDDPYCPRPVRPEPDRRAQVVARLREIARLLGQREESQKQFDLIGEQVDLEREANRAGWVDQDAVDVRFRQARGAAQYITTVEWLATEIEGSSKPFVFVPTEQVA